jgi:hypothetical protein
MLEAKIDHMFGRYEVRSYGFPIRVFNEEYCTLLQQRYGVEVVQVGGCDVFPPDQWHADGYNLVSKKLLNRKFGKNITQECLIASQNGSTRPADSAP